MGKLGTAIKLGQTAAQHARTAQDLHATSKNLHATATELRGMDARDVGRAAGHTAYTQGADTGKTVAKTWLKTFEVVPRLVCRGLQFLFALIACGFYVGANSNEGAAVWLFAITISSLSAATAVLFALATPLAAIPFIGGKMKLVKTYRAFAWDLALFVCWLVAFGVFAGIFLHRDNGDVFKGAKPAPMKAAVWIDLLNAVLWLVSGVYGAVKTFLGDKADAVTDKLGDKMFKKREVGAGPGKEAGYAESV
ncbi:hypothetical protein DPSP01_011774 [Paraphaeosphaeria sporulosa]|uniref:MARVEL domain-containing protein n=1 Tax=Paraphaeosphaeria sporulosa TaxID=1460663 RepID=A0A177BVJ9_9PLEO|nr:uncharacterized protein CC84DRAFT_1170031 [Paraphaeosphaeria sporulosa]OAF98567.1 hypothetical protein CC84DRAFT_1170031 [Paraphaeosphaeria sporulosa]